MRSVGAANSGQSTTTIFGYPGIDQAPALRGAAFAFRARLRTATVAGRAEENGFEVNANPTMVFVRGQTSTRMDARAAMSPVRSSTKDLSTKLGLGVCRSPEWESGIQAEERRMERIFLPFEVNSTRHW